MGERAVSKPTQHEENFPDADALMVALILAPGTFSRNRFFKLYQSESIWQARRRAQVVRSLIKELTDPWPTAGQLPSHPQAVVEQEVMIEGELHLQFSVPDLGYRRSVRLSAVEAAALRYCLDRAGKLQASEQDKRAVELCLSKLAPNLLTEPRVD